MRKVIPLVIVLWLVGCATATTPEARLFVACTSYVKSLRIINTLKPKLTAIQVQTIKNVVKVVRPICNAAAEGKKLDFASVLVTINSELRRLILIEQGVR